MSNRGQNEVKKQPPENSGDFAKLMEALSDCNPEEEIRMQGIAKKAIITLLPGSRIVEDESGRWVKVTSDTLTADDIEEVLQTAITPLAFYTICGIVNPDNPNKHIKQVDDGVLIDSGLFIAGAQAAGINMAQDERIESLLYTDPKVLPANSSAAIDSATSQGKSGKRAR